MNTTIIVSKSLVAAALLFIGVSAAAQQPDRESAAATLSTYKSAIERLNITDVDCPSSDNLRLLAV